jgi:hypothetical protein
MPLSKPNEQSWDLPRIAAEAVALERRFAANLHHGSDDGTPLIELIGEAPILISCPHAVNHPREGRLKLADTFTGPLTTQLARLTDAYALIYARTSAEDPNYDLDGPYKRRLADLVTTNRIEFVLDIHGIGRSRPVQLAIGTAQGTTIGHNLRLRECFLSCFISAGFSQILVDEPGQYDASRPTTIASYVWRTLNVPTIQVEIQKDFRDPEKSAANYVKVLRTLRESLSSVCGVLEKSE